MTTTSLNAPERSPHTTTTVAPVFALPLDDELDTSELEILQALAADGLLPDETEGVGHGGVLDDGGGAESYGGATESTQPDPEALPRHDGKASESFLQRFPLEDARCATDPVETDWVPSVEARVVPDDVIAVCRRCPGRAACLLWALSNDEAGYWAGTTKSERAELRAAGLDDVAAAERVHQARAARWAGGGSEPLHGPGEASVPWYRKGGCRCDECRELHRLKRAAERAGREMVAADTRPALEGDGGPDSERNEEDVMALIDQPWSKITDRVPVTHDQGELRAMDDLAFAVLIRQNLLPAPVPRGQSPKPAKWAWTQLWEALRADEELTQRTFDVLEDFRATIEAAVAAGTIPDDDERRVRLFRTAVDQAWDRLRRPDAEAGPLAWAGPAGKFPDNAARVIAILIQASARHRAAVQGSPDGPRPEDLALWEAMGKVGLDPKDYPSYTDHGD